MSVCMCEGLLVKGKTFGRMVAKGLSSWRSGSTAGGGSSGPEESSSGCPTLELQRGSYRDEPKKCGLGV